ncbi:MULTISPECIES: type II toxin-antitoxin system Phd/YefM family antitoxin [Hyphomicrobiales]|uniref:Type II toxin-antitoxin system Phd/YefM family antitoxin n=1 Tax=Bosea massiliensis TaxID=151419 RepID=A0ABW0NZL1_9HYPH|nr:MULTISPECIES: type II toxin-antitoxin system Phd/YefM family antitoxin [unclassified Bradyrhizobium]
MTGNNIVKSAISAAGWVHAGAYPVLSVAEQLWELTMAKATAAELIKNFSRYMDIAQREPIAVKSHGRVSTYLVSATAYEELQRYRQDGQQSFATKDLSFDLISLIAQCRMAPEHDYHNALLNPA